MKLEKINFIVEKLVKGSLVSGLVFVVLLWMTNGENWKITVLDDVANPFAYFLFLLMFIYLVLLSIPFSKVKVLKLLLIIPGLLVLEIILLSYFYFQRMEVHDETSFPDGTEMRLVENFALTDVVFSVWKKSKSNWFVWERMRLTLNYTEAGVFTSNPQLKVTNGYDRLLISRGGIWSDCFELSIMQTCAGIESILHSSEVELIKKNSEAIERLTGLKPQK